MIIAGIILTVIGGLILLGFLLSIVKCQTRTEAVVSKVIVKKMFARGRTIKRFTPVFTYQVNDKKYSQKADTETGNPDRFVVGQKVIVYTDSKNPERMRYGSNIGYFLCGLVILSLGIFIIVLVFM